METATMGYIGYRIWGIYRDLSIIYPKPDSIYLRGTISAVMAVCMCPCSDGCVYVTL